MKQFALFDKDTRRYYNFARDSWSVFLTYGCLSNGVNVMAVVQELGLSNYQTLEVCVGAEQENRVVDEVIAF